jgi:transposase
MTTLKLSSQERRRLQALAARTADAGLLRRAQALLWLASGHGIEDVTRRLCVCRRAVYYWVEQYAAREADDLAGRLSATPRSGRPRTARGIIDPLIDNIIDTDPRELGYRSTVWTAGLLRQYLSESHRLPVSQRSVSYALSRLSIRWKRPRHRLALRARYWRQAKGGSSAASRGANAPSS